MGGDSLNALLMHGLTALARVELISGIDVV